MKKYWLGAFLLTSLPAWGVLPYGSTPAEVAMCEARGMPSGQGRYQGHYCDGLRFLDRAYSAMGNKREMNYYLGVAIDNFNYELNRTNVDKARQGEFHVGKARALKLMGKKAEAAAEFNKALSYEINSPDVYQALADHFHETGNKKKALEMATEGLKRNPNSRVLKRRYTEFGGKLPYPEALAETIPGVETNVTVKPVDKSESTTAIGETASDIPAPTTIEPSPQAESAKIGSPKNPYCRFCPD
jgi:tetratricopeptide (TPR) repeat protein